MSRYEDVYADERLSHRARAVYLYLHGRADAEGKCWPGVKRIAADLRLSRRTAPVISGAVSDTARTAAARQTCIRCNRRKNDAPLRHGGSAASACHKGRVIMTHLEPPTLPEDSRQRKKAYSVCQAKGK